jgi:hypothetical protein
LRAVEPKSFFDFGEGEEHSEHVDSPRASRASLCSWLTPRAKVFELDEVQLASRTVRAHPAFHFGNKVHLGVARCYPLRMSLERECVVYWYSI